MGAIRQITPVEDIRRTLEEGAERVRRSALEELAYAGERATREARAGGGRDYTDRTGNLRSSTGFVVTYKGHVEEMSSYDPVSPTATEGPKEGPRYAEELAREAPTRGSDTATLFVTAGMSYAAYVEARGYNVLRSAEWVARDYLRQRLQERG